MNREIIIAKAKKIIREPLLYLLPLLALAWFWVIPENPLFAMFRNLLFFALLLTVFVFVLKKFKLSGETILACVLSIPFVFMLLWYLISAYQTANMQHQGTFTDARDGKVYSWKFMPDGKKWMTVNLDYAGNGGLYYNGESNPPFAGAGRLYTWEQAKTAAPAGWHLPSDAEWAALAKAAGGTGSYGEIGTAGKKLKANHTWSPQDILTGTDDFGFSALPSGYRDVSNTWLKLGLSGVWWSSTEYSSTYVYYRSMDYNNERMYRGYDDKTYLFSVRCLQN